MISVFISRDAPWLYWELLQSEDTYPLSCGTSVWLHKRDALKKTRHNITYINTDSWMDWIKQLSFVTPTPTLIKMLEKRMNQQTVPTVWLYSKNLGDVSEQLIATRGNSCSEVQKKHVFVVCGKAFVRRFATNRLNKTFQPTTGGPSPLVLSSMMSLTLGFSAALLRGFLAGGGV